MKFKIFFLLENGDIDDLVITASTIEEIQRLAQEEVVKRGAIDAWSQEMK